MRYTEEQKQEAIKLAAAIGCHSAGLKLGMYTDTIERWIRESKNKPCNTYTEEQKQEVIKLAKDIGYYKAGKQLGINKITIRRWLDPEFKDKSNESNRINQIKYYHKHKQPKLRKGPYADEQKQEAIKLAKEIGYTRAGRELGLTMRTIKKWAEPEYANKARIKSKEYTLNTHDARKAKWKEYRDNNKEVIKSRIGKWKDDNPDYHRDYNKKHYAENPQPHNEKCKARHKERIKNDPIYKAKETLRRRLKDYVKKQINGEIKISRHDIGCSWDEFVKYLESKFLPGMTWDNHGPSYYDENGYYLSKEDGGKFSHGWEFDHIKSLTSFGDLILTEEGQKQATHYTNIQPLWKVDNIIKGDK